MFIDDWFYFCYLTKQANIDTVSPSSCTVIPEETAGPFPGDGSNGANALALTGIVRSADKSSNHTVRSTERFSSLNLPAFASIGNAICATNGA
jgi:hypothetical protein